MRDQCHKDHDKDSDKHFECTKKADEHADCVTCETMKPQGGPGGHGGHSDEAHKAHHEACQACNGAAQACEFAEDQGKCMGDNGNTEVCKHCQEGPRQPEAAQTA